MRHLPSLRSATATLLAASLGLVGVPSSSHADRNKNVERAAVPEGAIDHILLINLENENFTATFGEGSPATYLNGTLRKQGQLIVNYFATSHVSLGNYLSQVSGQAPTASQNNDCIDLSSLSHPPVVGGFTNISPGTLAADKAAFPGQIVGDGCVFPARALTIGDQLDAPREEDEKEPSEQERADKHRTPRWRAYAEDMGLDPARDYGTPDANGGTTCAHPPINGVDHSNSAAATDQYATRHNPFVYFHSVIDDQARCDEHVVPLGQVVVGRNGSADAFRGHLYEDLQQVKTTPSFMFVTPNLCNDAHDAKCVGTNTEGGHEGGLVAADLWLKHWMPMIFASPAYRSGKMLVVLTFDESGFSDSRACPAADQASCGSPIGPNVTNPGYSPILGQFGLQTPPSALYTYAGGGQVGAVVFNPRFVVAGSVNNTGYYNHYSALRSYEDILGLQHGGDDGLGHLGYAAKPSVVPFGRDVFNNTNGKR